MKDKLKNKVIIGFALATSLVLIVSFYTISNFLQLQQSINQLSVPDQKLILINKLLTDISETETFVRSYTLTGHNRYLNNYYENSDMIYQIIDSLKNMTRNSESQFEKIDSIAILWNKKTHNFSDFIKLENRARKRDFSTRAIDKISKEALDSVKSMRTTKSTSMAEKLQVPDLKPVTSDQKHEKNKEESTVFNFLGNLFSKKKKNKNEQEKEDNTTPAINKDTLKTIAQKHIRYDTIITQEDASKVIDKVVDILADLRQQESSFNVLLTNKKYDLLLDDILIMENMRTMLRDLQQEELRLASTQTRQSKAFAEKSINVIFIVGLAGLILSAVFIYLIISDISKSNFYKKRLEKAKRKAEKLARVKEEFLANMSHEIRTPLSAILGFTDQLAQTPLKEKQHYFFQAIKNSSVHLLNTVNDILDFSKLEAGKLSIENVPVKLHKELEEIYHTFKLKAEEKGIFLEQQYQFDTDLIIMSDAFRIKQIMLNLLSNAIKFTDQGKVTIFANALPGEEGRLWLELEVRDTGTGIPPNKIMQIFRGFEQADTSITRQYGGTGLGLAISRRLANMMSGKLSVASEVGKGSTFTLKLPVTVGSLADYMEHEAPLSFDFTLLKGKKVLVADDDEYNILLFHTILKKWDVEVDLASNGAEALKFLLDNDYDLVLTDVNMPEISGIELVKKVKSELQNYSDVPFLCITANVFHDASYECFDGFVLKPFTEQALFNKIAQALQLSVAIEPEEDVDLENDRETTEDSETVSLQDLEKFADGDWDMVKSMTTDLISNNRLNMLQMNNALDEENKQRVTALAHKMQPSFAHVKANNVLASLKQLEYEIDSLSWEQIAAKIQLLNQMTSKVFNILEAKINQVGQLGA